MSQNVAEFLLRHQAPERPALHTLAGDYTYGQLKQAAGCVASYLLRQGEAKGNLVILAGENSFFWVAAYLGIAQAGCVATPLPASTSPGYLAHVIRITDARTIFADAAFARRMEVQLDHATVVTDGPVNPSVGHQASTTFPRLLSNGCESATAFASTTSDDLAALMFTSGSTGTPRGVMVTHGNIIANTNSIIEYLHLTAGDRMMDVLPFHYCFGTSLLHTHLRVGGSLVLESRFMYPEVVLARMIETKCTGFAGVPSHFQLLLRRSSMRQKRFPDLRYIQQAGGPLAPSCIGELQRALPGVQIFVMYGQTEATARLSYLPPEMLDKKPGSVGKGIPGVTLSVVNETGAPVGLGEVGEVVAEGRNITKGYWHCPSDSAVTFRNGKLHTGDLATIDEDGFIYIVGRIKDLLKCGGIRISCRELEDRVLACDGVLESCVIGIADDLLGDAVKLYLVPRDETDRDLIRRVLVFCRQSMPPPLVPKEIVVVPALPKNSAGKVLRERLRQDSMPNQVPGACRPERISDSQELNHRAEENVAAKVPYVA